MAPELVRQLTTPEVGEMEQAGFGAPSEAAPATDAMAGGGVKEEEMELEEEEHGLGFVLALPAVAVPLAVLVAFLLRGVPRRARSLLPRANPTGWRGLRLPAPAPEAGRPRRPRRQRARLAPGDDLDGGDAETPPRKRRRMPAKGGRRCENCGAEETPQWRLSEMGTLCNACGVRLRVNNSLERLERPRKRKAAGPTPAAPTAGTVAEPLPAPPAVTEGAFPEPPPAGTVAEPPPVPPALMEGTFAGPPLAPESPASESTQAAESPISDSPPYSPDTPMWMRHAEEEKEEEEEEEEEVYLVKRKRPKRVQKKKKTPTTQQYKSAPWPPVTDKKCAHCGSSKTPQWRNGPMGRATLCNACGVRCRQGKLFPEYRPAASPTFERSKHASLHRDVLKLRQQQQQGGGGGGGDNQHPPPPPEQAQQPADDGLPNLHMDGNGGPADAPLSGGGGGGGDGGLTDELQLPQLQQVKEQYPPTPLHQPLPMDSIVDPGASGLINDPADAPANFADLVAGGLNDPANFGGLDGPANFVDPGSGGFDDPANFGGLNDPANAPASFGGNPFDFADLDGLLDGPSASPLHPDFFK